MIFWINLIDADKQCTIKRDTFSVIPVNLACAIGAWMCNHVAHMLFVNSQWKEN